jgi:Fe-coproporphyrin III synthase
MATSLYSIIQRYLTLRSDRIYELPVVILMPHSACNCRCIMCDIWKGNKNVKQLTEVDLTALLSTLKKFKTKLVVMSGGEALLHEQFFSLCKILRNHNIRIQLLSTGLTLKYHAINILANVDQLIVSLDGPEAVHNEIRKIPNAFQKLKEGVQALKSMQQNFCITARSVVQKQNYKYWSETIDAAKEIGLNQISFLPADISSHAFNREELWDENRQDDIRISKSDLPLLKNKAEEIIKDYKTYFDSHFIAESPDRLRKLVQHYYAIHGLSEYPEKKCNAPWVSTVVEADGTIRPCFFHESIGNIHHDSLDNILNSESAVQFRKSLDISMNDTCKKCVCYLNLKPTAEVR